MFVLSKHIITQRRNKLIEEETNKVYDSLNYHEKIAFTRALTMPCYYNLSVTKVVEMIKANPLSFIFDFNKKTKRSTVSLA